jgi:phage-related protein
MADNTSGENLVSQITVTGGNEAAAEIQSFADKGSAAFDKLDASVSKSANDVAASSDRIAASTARAATAIGAAGNSAPAAASKMDIFKTGLKNVEDALGNLTSKIPQLTQAIGRFSQRMAIAGAGVVAAGIKIGNTASQVAGKVNGSSDAFEENTNQLIAANNSMGQAEASSIQYAHSQDALLKQLQQGKISYSQYGQALQQLSSEYDDQMRLNAQLENAQERTRLENERLKKSFEDRKAYAALIDTFGGPLTSSLTQFGNQINQVHQDFITAFSPAGAALVDQIGQAFTKNAPAINAFFQDASSKIQTLIQTNGPQLQKFFENLGSAGASVFNGIIAAAPGVIDFVNNKLVPAFSKVGSILDTVASVVNAVFGTQFTAGGLVAVAIIGQLTGSFKLLFTILKLTGSIGNGVFKIIGESALTLSKLIGGGKLSEGLIKFGTAAVTSGGFFKTFFNIIKAGVPLVITLVEVVAGALGVSFGVALPIVVALGAALYFIIKNVDWKAFGAAAKDALAGLFGILARLAGGLGKIGDSIRGGLSDAWDFVKQKASDALDFIINQFTSFPGNLANIASAVGGLFSSAWDSIKSGAGTALDFIIGQFTAFPGNLANIANAIGGLFSSAWESIKSGAGIAVQFVVDQFNTFSTNLGAIADAIGGLFEAGWQLIKDGASGTVQFITDQWNNLLSFFGTVGGLISSGVDTAWQAIQDAASAAAQFVQDGWNAIVTFFQGIPGTLQATWDGIKTAITTAFQSAWDTVKNAAKSFVDTVKSYLQPLIDLINTIKDGISSALGGDGGGPPGFATGGSPNGHIRGPGTTTSDSILARLSNNEFVMRAKAVAKYGVGFMNAINSGQFQLPNNFAFGGFIAPSPVRRVAFADGGQVKTGGGLQPLNLTIGQDTFEGILMPEEVGNKLTKYAVSRQNRSAGRKPAWIGNRRN